MRPAEGGSGPKHDPARHIGRSALLLALLGGLALILTLIWQLVIAAFFGTSSGLDAFWIAFALPKAVVDSVHLGVLTLLFILVFNLRSVASEEDRSRLASSVFNLVLLSTLVLVPALFWGAPYLVRWMAPGLSPEAHQLASRMMPSLSLVLLPTAITGGLAGVLHARQRFMPFALSRVAGIGLQIALLVALAPRLGVDALIWATLLGALAMLLFCFPAFGRSGFRYSATLSFRGDEAKAVIGLVVALAGFAFLERLNQVSDRFFASMLAPGSVSALEFGWRFEIPVSQVLSFSVALPSFALMAVQAAELRFHDLRRTVEVSVRLVALLVVPLVGFLVVLRHPVVDLWFERGSFTPEASSLVASLIPPLAVIFLLRAFGIIMLFGLLSTRRHKALLAILSLEVVTNTVLNALLVGPLGLPGIVLATASAMLASNLWLWALFLRALEGWSVRSFAKSVWKPAAVSLTSWALLFATHEFFLLGKLASGERALAIQLAGLGMAYLALHALLARLSGVIDMRRRREAMSAESRLATLQDPSHLM